ncbi:MAG TPA: SLBB domain-containing protein [Candidatus Wunengus sp. YC61]|uniref:SLBB domain-containing protein n=1 Tax=Candidatus Wunengus sp. YC61 TaxID=3367698 RepID=UPI0040252E04
MSKNPKILVLPILWLACLFSCNLHAASATGPEILQEDLSTYIIGPGDKLGISVFRNSDMDSSPQVDTMGNISVPLLEDMKVSGLTTYQLRDKITEGLRKYITNPQVTVSVSTYQSQKVTIMGEVSSPGILQLEQPQPISIMITKCGGFTENANEENVTVIRKDPKGSQQIITVNVKKVFKEGDAKQNILIYKDDIIYVPKDERKITILGEVSSPGIINIKGTVGILEAIAKVGGFTDEANKNSVIIMGKDGKSNVRVLDYQQILENKDLSKDVSLSDGEVIYVPRENKQVLLLGEIQNPGVLSNDPPQTLLEAIVKKGGFAADGNKSKVVVIRRGADKANIMVYNLKKFLKEGDASQNIVLQKSDVVYVPPTFMASTEKVLSHVRNILSVILSAESAISFWPQTRQVLETGESSTTSGIVISPGQ